MIRLRAECEPIAFEASPGPTDTSWQPEREALREAAFTIPSYRRPVAAAWHAASERAPCPGLSLGTVNMGRPMFVVLTRRRAGVHTCGHCGIFGTGWQLNGTSAASTSWSPILATDNRPPGGPGRARRGHWHPDRPGVPRAVPEYLSGGPWPGRIHDSLATRRGTRAPARGPSSIPSQVSSCRRGPAGGSTGKQPGSRAKPEVAARWRPAPAPRPRPGWRSDAQSPSWATASDLALV